MSKAAAVANLNQAAGKTSPAKRKRAVAAEDIIFIPSKNKNRRPTNAVKPMTSKSAPPIRAPRNVLPRPSGSDDDSQDGPRLVPKLRRLNLAQKANESPLKKRGLDPGDEPAPRGVNVSDSPAKNTRSRFKVVLPPKPAQNESVEGKEPRGKSTALPGSSDKTSTSSKPTSDDDESEGELFSFSDTSGEEERGEEDEEDGEEAEPIEGSTGAAINENIKDGNELEGGQPSTLASLAQQIGAISPANETIETPKSRRLPATTATGAVETTQQEHDEQFEDSEEERSDDNEPVTLQDGLGGQAEGDVPPESAATDLISTTQRRDEEDEERHRRRGEQFIELIGLSAHWHHCSNAWASAGGAAVIIRQSRHKVQPKSTWCKTLQRRLQEIGAACKDYRKGYMDEQEAGQMLTHSIARTRALCDQIPAFGVTTVRQHIVLDLYRYAVPGLVVILRAYLRAYGQSNTPFEGATLKMFVQLLQITQSLVERAVSWQPRPSTLEKGLAQSMRRHIRPAVRQIVDRFSLQLKKFEHETQTDSALAELEAAQVATLEALKVRRASMYARADRAVHPLPTWIRMGHGSIYDIDMKSGTAIPGDRYNTTGMPVSVPARPRVQRQVTEEIVPPPMDWTEEEKTALLNALERFQGDDRYWQISRACVELHDRSIEELRAAALYFKELIVGAPEFAEHLHADFQYLLSLE